MFHVGQRIQQFKGVREAEGTVLKVTAKTLTYETDNGETFKCSQSSARAIGDATPRRSPSSASARPTAQATPSASSRPKQRASRALSFDDETSYRSGADDGDIKVNDRVYLFKGTREGWEGTVVKVTSKTLVCKTDGEAFRCNITSVRRIQPRRPAPQHFGNDGPHSILAHQQRAAPSSSSDDEDDAETTMEPLLKVASARGLTRALIDHGVKMPEHVPQVCASFATQNLASDGRSHDGHDGAAGHDPWSICDYLRESLYWPKDTIYIDKEQVGMYMYERGHTNSYTNNQDVRPWCRPGTFETEPVDEARDVPQRNYRSVYKWAQRSSKLQLIFVSRDYLLSANCIVELQDCITLAGTRDSSTKAIALILLECDLPRDPLRALKRMARGSQQVSVKTFELGMYEDRLLHGEGSKYDLRDAAATIQELREFCKAVIGTGDPADQMREMEYYLANRDHPSVLRSDLRKHRVRSPYRSAEQRRIRLNQSDSELDSLQHELQQRLPMIGSGRAADIVDFLRTNRPITDVWDLEDIGGIGDGILRCIEPFVTVFGQDADRKVPRRR
eukprot:m.294188 g.294188  ORF g.294188 m.294188 type:complete len:561 (-) comp39772_c0_seq1:69-1751(-)